MIPLLDIPEIVQHYAPYFRSVFSEAAFLQFQRYLSGLIVSENKTIEGINRLFVLQARNQSSLNRLLTESPFSEHGASEGGSDASRFSGGRFLRGWQQGGRADGGRHSG